MLQPPSTFTNSPPDFSIYQSNGLCQTFCVQSYAFAIVQDNLCWCSNYAPGADKESTSKCNTKCPGYPTEMCGGNDLFGYIKLEKPVVGTKSTDGTGVTATSDKVRFLASEFLTVSRRPIMELSPFVNSSPLSSPFS